MIVLGIDPGVATIGFGVVRAERQKNTLVQYGVITTPPGIPLSSRLLQISDDMEEPGRICCTCYSRSSYFRNRRCSL